MSLICSTKTFLVNSCSKFSFCKQNLQLNLEQKLQYFSCSIPNWLYKVIK